MEQICEFINYDRCQDLATKMGRACHLLKAKCQGRTYLPHPELYSIDVISGEIEGQVRGFRGNLKMNWEVKGYLFNIVKSAYFMQKILKPDFFGDKKISKETLSELRDITAFIADCAKALDREITIAFVNQSNEMTEDLCAQIQPILVKEISQVNFDYSTELQQIQKKETDKSEQIKICVLRLAEFMGNKAHENQEQVTEFVHTTGLKDFANEIINMNGEIENKSRETIGYIRERKDANSDDLKRLTNEVREKLQKQKEFVQNQTFKNQKLTNKIIEILDFQEHVSGAIIEFSERLILAN